MSKTRMFCFLLARHEHTLALSHVGRFSLKISKSGLPVPMPTIREPCGSTWTLTRGYDLLTNSLTRRTTIWYSLGSFRSHETLRIKKRIYFPFTLFSEHASIAILTTHFTAKRQLSSQHSAHSSPVQMYYPSSLLNQFPFKLACAWISRPCLNYKTLVRVCLRSRLFNLLFLPVLSHIICIHLQRASRSILWTKWNRTYHERAGWREICRQFLND